MTNGRKNYNEYAESLRTRLTESFAEQGFEVTPSGIEAPNQSNKEALRRLHETAVRHRVARASALRAKELALVKRIAAGSEVQPACISPRLVEVQPRSNDELLFR